MPSNSSKVEFEHMQFMINGHNLLGPSFNKRIKNKFLRDRLQNRRDTNTISWKTSDSYENSKNIIWRADDLWLNRLVKEHNNYVTGLHISQFYPKGLTQPAATNVVGPLVSSMPASAQFESPLVRCTGPHHQVY